MAALIMDGSALILAILMAITHGDELPLPALLTRSGWLDGSLGVSGQCFWVAQDSWTSHEADHEGTADVEDELAVDEELDVPRNLLRRVLGFGAGLDVSG